MSTFPSHVLYRLPILLVVVLITSCGQREPQRPPDITWQQCLEELTDLARLPALDPVNLTMITSFDRRGGNNDFNNFTGQGTEPGWFVMADVKGPGCIRRFWMTGTDPGHPIRIYIDGERKPRFDTTVDALFSGAGPWIPPLSQYVNMCYYSYVPLTYQSSIRIEIKEPNTHPLWGPRRIFYQIAAERFPEGKSVESFPATFSAGQSEAIEHVAARLTGWIENRATFTEPPAVTSTIEPGTTGIVWEHTGSGTLASFSLQVEPAERAAWTREQEGDLINALLLRIRYDDATTDSIDVPLGAFFANAWDRRAFGAAWMTSGPAGYACRLPMPFARSIRISLHNRAAAPVTVHFSPVHHDQRRVQDGYLHAEYRRSGPDKGNHLITRVEGRGKYLGCFLGVTGLGKSWWILEGDERIWVDTATAPAWHGTGLEDYFNGGWYYRGSVFGAFSGNFDRAPFRVGQFRHHMSDPVTFSSLFHMEFERMNDEQTGAPVSGFFESVAYWYQDRPSTATPQPLLFADRPRIAFPNDQATFMLQLTELERANDIEAALAATERYPERYPEADDIALYRLRALEYRRLLGESIAADALAPFLAGEYGPQAQEQAKLLDWFYSGEHRALVGLYANGRARLAINGNPVLGGDHPFNLFVAGIETQPSDTLKLSAQVEWMRSDPWLQAGVRTRDGVGGTGPGTAATLQPHSDWATADLNTLTDWHRVGIREIPRGVPDAPYIGGVANAFVLLQSKSYPVTALNWSYYRGNAYFREDVALPISNKPDFHRTMTGLTR